MSGVDAGGAPAATAAPATGAPAPVAAPTAAPVTLDGMLPESMWSQGAQYLNEFKGKSPVDLATSYLAARSQLAAAPTDVVTIPKTAEERRATLKKFGAPADGKYAFNPPEGKDPKYYTEGFRGTFDEISARIGLHPEDHAEILNAFGEFSETEIAKLVQEDTAAREAALQEGEAALRKEFGADEQSWSKFVAEEALGLDRLGGDALKAVLDDAGVLGDATVRKALALVGSMMSDADVPTGGGAGGSASATSQRAAAEKELNELTAKAIDDRLPQHERDAINKRMEVLGKMLSGTKRVI